MDNIPIFPSEEPVSKVSPAVEPLCLTVPNELMVYAHNSEVESNTANDSRLRRFGRYMLFKQTALVEWSAGITAGNLAVEGGLNRSVATGAVLYGVYKSEFAQVKWAHKKSGQSFAETAPVRSVMSRQPLLKRIKKNIGRAVKATPKETVALASSMWQGAPATMKHNEAFGIRNTRKRGQIQSAEYGIAVAYWVTDLPLAGRLRNSAVESGKFLVENPLESMIGSAVVGTVLFGIYEKIHQHRKNK